MLLESLENYERKRKELEDQKEEIKKWIQIDLISIPRIWERVTLQDKKVYLFPLIPLPAAFQKTEETFKRVSSYFVQHYLCFTTDNFVLELTETFKLTSATCSTNYYQITFFDFAYLPSQKHTIDVVVKGITEIRCFQYSQDYKIASNPYCIKDFYPNLASFQFQTFIDFENKKEETKYYKKVLSHFSHQELIPTLKTLCKKDNVGKETTQISCNKEVVSYSITYQEQRKMRFESGHDLLFQVCLKDHPTYLIEVTISKETESASNPFLLNFMYICDSNICISIGDLSIQDLIFSK